MKVEKNTVVTLAYSVTDPDNNVLDSGDTPITYLQGGYDGIFAKIEDALEGKQICHTVTISLEPDEAFGEYDAEMVHVESRDTFPGELEIGQFLEGAPEGGDEDETLLFRVTDMAEGKVVLDANHPLAGVVLDFACTVSAIRAASPAEIAAGGLVE